MDGGDWLALIGIVGAALAFVTGLYQYVIAQQWKRKEFVATEIKAFESDEVVRQVMGMLDYVDRPIEFRSDAPPVVVTEELLACALRPHTHHDGFHDEEVLIRDAFDHFLNRLELFEHFIEAGLVSFHEFERYLQYWVGIMSDRSSKRKASSVLDTLWWFIQFYEYDGVQNLAARFGYHITPSNTLDELIEGMPLWTPPVSNRTWPRGG